MARILIVDDNAANRLLIVTVLSHDNHTVIEAADGAEGLEMAREHRPGLIIVDLYMPGMHGTAFIKTLRGDPHLARSIIALYTSTYPDAAMRDFMQLYHIEHIIPKPAEPQAILTAVRAALNV